MLKPEKGARQRYKRLVARALDEIADQQNMTLERVQLDIDDPEKGCGIGKKIDTVRRELQPKQIHKKVAICLHKRGGFPYLEEFVDFLNVGGLPNTEINQILVDLDLRSVEPNGTPAPIPPQPKPTLETRFLQWLRRYRGVLLLIGLIATGVIIWLATDSLRPVSPIFWLGDNVVSNSPGCTEDTTVDPAIASKTYAIEVKENDSGRSLSQASFTWPYNDLSKNTDTLPYSINRFATNFDGNDIKYTVISNGNDHKVIVDVSIPNKLLRLGGSFSKEFCFVVR